jgi:general secretion pathway protein L
MPRTIIGLDISEDTVAAVQVKSLMQGGYQIIGCSAVPVTEAGGVSTALQGVFEDIDPKGSACNSVIEDGHVAFRNLSMPFADLKKIRQTLGFELETEKATSVEEQLNDFIDIDRTDSETNLIAASVNRDYIRDHLEIYEPLGIDPEILDIRNVSLANQLLLQKNRPDSGVLLNIGSKLCSLILFQERKIVLIRHLPYNGSPLAEIASLAAKRESLEALDSRQLESGLEFLSRAVNLTLQGYHVETRRELNLGRVFVTGPGALVPITLEILKEKLDLPVSSLDLREDTEDIMMDKHLAQIYNPALMDNCLALALREGRKAKGFNFRREEFQVKTQFVKLKKELIHASIYLCVIFLLLGINFGIDYQDLKKRNDDLDKQIKGIFSQTFPEITKIVDPLHQMRTQVSELKNASGTGPGINIDSRVMEILNDISMKIPADLKIQVDRMVVDQDGVQLRGTTDNFNTVDSIKKGLESSEMYGDVTIASANLDKSGKGVRFEIRMNRNF